MATQIISGKLDGSINTFLDLFVYGYAYKWDGVWTPISDNKINQISDKERYITPALVETYTDANHYIVLENTIDLVDYNKYTIRYMIVSKTLSLALIHYSSICFNTDSLKDWLGYCGLLHCNIYG